MCFLICDILVESQELHLKESVNGSSYLPWKLLETARSRRGAGQNINSGCDLDSMSPIAVYFVGIERTNFLNQRLQEAWFSVLCPLVLRILSRTYKGFCT